MPVPASRRANSSRQPHFLTRVAEIKPDDYQSLMLSIQIYRSLGREAEMQNAAQGGR